ncbi:serine hydrolase domain-containing protein [Streptomyces sp. NPDC086777]|uniref:serine hydrolase domain-containing protein n=1 Tax=Streptomyces sp. NPDC086777 TaxID=3154866 RepID=UPI00345047B8
MAHLKVEVDPAEAGFDAARLERIDRAFGRHVDEGRLPGWLVVVARQGEILHLSSGGRRDVANDLPVEFDTRWRLFSMTKPITSVAAMTLYERGVFDLTDPISRWLPEFSNPRVYTHGSALAPVTTPATEPIRIWHLLSHTAGLTYGFGQAHPVDALYRESGFPGTSHPQWDLAESVARLARLPLLHQPGQAWNYSMATDVLGRLIEVASGTSLDEYVTEQVLHPLGMCDTTFGVSGQDEEKLARLYALTSKGPVPADESFDRQGRGHPVFESGGAGLVSTAGDYNRFARFLCRGGELEGTRLLAPRTLKMMTSNHLPDRSDIAAFGSPLALSFEGYGFGLGFAVLQDPVAAHLTSSVGEFGWGGGAGTDFWVDPVEELTVLFFTHQVPSMGHGRELRRLVYQALV